MKKYINIAFIYATLALISGVVYREITKFAGFTGKTTLSLTHVHFFMLGTIVFLIIALFSINTSLTEEKYFKKFMWVYNIALLFMVTMFYVRGFSQVYLVEVSKGMNGAISGMSGVAHILLTIGLVFLYLSFKNCKVLTNK